MHIELRDIHKYFGPVKANNGINLTVDAGEIHGILGENGAGKSTLMKILAGFSHQTRGKIFIDGTAVDYRNPAHAADLGIGMLYQDPLDFPLLSVLDNFMLGQTNGLSSQKRKFSKRFNALAESSIALKLDVRTAFITKGAPLSFSSMAFSRPSAC